MQRPDFRIRIVPPASGEFEKIKVVLNIGFFHGLETARAMLAMSRYFEVVYIYLDENNAWKRRFWRFMTPEKRRILQNWVYLQIRKLGYPDHLIIRDRFDPVDYVDGVRESKAEFILAATFPKIPTEAIDEVDGRFVLLHPTGKIHGNLVTLPEEMQGARVMDKICNVSEAEFRIAMLQGLPIVDGKGWDAGPILELGEMAKGPKFTPDQLPIDWEPGDPDPPVGSAEWNRLAYRVQVGQLVTSKVIPDLLQTRLLKKFVSLDYALGTGMTALECVKQGWNKIKVVRRNCERRGVIR